MKKFLALILAAVMLLSCGAALAEDRMTDRFMPPHVNEGQYPIPGNKTLSWWMEINKSAVARITDQRLSNRPSLLTTIKSGIMPPPMYIVMTIRIMTGFLSISPGRVSA